MAASGPLTLPEGALDELPVFPLPGAVLLTGAHLELHVFEPRYRALLEHCMQTHGLMAIAQVTGASANDDLPSIAQVAGLGSVEHRTTFPDGRSHIVLVGRARVRLAELPFVPPFRRARATVVDDVEGVPPSRADELALNTALHGFVEALRKEGPRVVFERPADMPLAEVAQHVAQHLVFDAKVRQEILEMRDPCERIGRVTQALLAQRAELEGASSTN